MAHDAASVPAMQNPSQRFCKAITGINGPWNKIHDGATTFFPILNRKELDADVAWPFRWGLSINHLNSGLVAAMQCRRFVWGASELKHDSPKMFGMFCGQHDVIEIAVSTNVVVIRVVARRPEDGESIPELIVEHGICELNGAAGRETC